MSRARIVAITLLLFGTLSLGACTDPTAPQQRPAPHAGVYAGSST